MTIEEAIQDLEVRKRILQASCLTCWDPAIEMALQALKEKKDHPIILCRECRYSYPIHPDMGLWTCKRQGRTVIPEDYCSDARREHEDD